jgi:hypothetical protein
MRREASTSCDPAGSRTASSATASRHSRLSSSSRWSRTNATGAAIAETADANRGSTVPSTETPAEARAWNTPGSRRSTETQATRFPFRAAHWARTVVLP